jgi:hypothetical protein
MDDEPLPDALPFNIAFRRFAPLSKANSRGSRRQVPARFTYGAGSASHSIREEKVAPLYKGRLDFGQLIKLRS